MFNLTLHDHLHLTFNEILERHKSHTAKARTRARWSQRLRAAEAVLIGCASIAATGVAYGRSYMFAVAAAVLAALALLVVLIQLSFELDASARAHATLSAQLWALRERYRGLLSDVHDGVLTVADARVRRDQLLEDLKDVFGTTPITGLEVGPGEPPASVSGPVSGSPRAYKSA